MISCPLVPISMLGSMSQVLGSWMLPNAAQLLPPSLDLRTPAHPKEQLGHGWEAKAGVLPKCGQHAAARTPLMHTVERTRCNKLGGDTDVANAADIRRTTAALGTNHPTLP